MIIEAKIVSAANADVADNTDVAPVNLTLHSCFSDVDLEINKKLIIDSNGPYIYHALYKSLLKYDKSYLETQNQSKGFY